MATKKTKRIRWECPTGDHTSVLGPLRPRKDSIVRYCLPCSEATGKLVERKAPVLEKMRAAKTASRKTKTQKKREREQAKANEWPLVLHKLFARVKKLKCWHGEAKHAYLAKLRYSKTRTHAPGHASWGGRITMTAGSDVGSAIETLVHEVCHVVYFERHGTDDAHGQKFHSMLIEAARELIGDEYLKSPQPKKDTKYALDWVLNERYSQAVKDGMFPELKGLPPIVEPPKPKRRKRRKRSKLPLGRVQFSIPGLVQTAIGMDDPSRKWSELYPELAKAYKNGVHRRSGKGYTTTVEGPIALVEEAIRFVLSTPVNEPNEWQAADRFDSKLRKLRLETKGRIAQALCALVAAMRKL